MSGASPIPCFSYIRSRFGLVSYPPKRNRSNQARREQCQCYSTPANNRLLRIGRIHHEDRSTTARCRCREVRSNCRQGRAVMAIGIIGLDSGVLRGCWLRNHNNRRGGWTIVSCRRRRLPNCGCLPPGAVDGSRAGLAVGTTGCDAVIPRAVVTCRTAAAALVIISSPSPNIGELTSPPPRCCRIRRDGRLDIAPVQQGRDLCSTSRSGLRL